MNFDQSFAGQFETRAQKTARRSRRKRARVFKLSCETLVEVKNRKSLSLTIFIKFMYKPHLILYGRIVNVLTLFRSELELRGSSAANIAEETMMQTRTTLPKQGWLQMKWHMIRNLEDNNKCSTHDFTKLIKKKATSPPDLKKYLY